MFGEFAWEHALGRVAAPTTLENKCVRGESEDVSKLEDVRGQRELLDAELGEAEVVEQVQ